MAEITATNPRTGERLVLRDGQWVSAESPFPTSAASTNEAVRQAQVGTRERAVRARAEGRVRNEDIGFGQRVAAPFTDMFRSQPRQRAAAESVASAGRYIAQQAQTPLDIPRLGADTAANVGAAIHDLPQVPGMLARNAPAIARGVTYGPWQDERAARVDELTAQDLGNSADTAGAANRGNAAAVQSGVNLAAPLLMGGSTSALRAAGTGAAIDAPFALTRGQGDLQERLPSALTEILGSGATTGLLAAASNAAPRIAAALPSAAANRAGQFEAAGVRPTLAALQAKEAAPIAQAIAENPIGGNVRANLENSVEDTANAARGIAGRYGSPADPSLTGENVQAAARRFSSGDGTSPRSTPVPLPEAYSTPSRDSSFDAKATALYSHVEGRIEAAENHILQGGGPPPRLGAMPALTVTTNTQAALAAILGRVRNPAIAAETTDPQLARFAQLMETPDRVHFGDLRAFRTYVRGLMSKPMLRTGVDDAGMNRLYGALSEDIRQSARNIAGPSAAHMLQRVDTFYRAGNNRIQRALQAFVGKGDNPVTPTAAYERMRALAGQTSRANGDALLSLKRSMRPEEWRNVAASFVDHLGSVKPNAGNALEPGAFSVDNFVANYARLSPQGRRILFGSLGGGTEGLAQELDNLAQVAGYQKGVRGFTNFSRSGVSINNMGTIAMGAAALSRAAVGDYAPLGGFVGGLAAARITGEMLTNPAFVRWLVGAQRASRAAGAGGTLSRARLVELGRLAATDPALAPLYADLVQRQQGQTGGQSPGAPGSGGGPARALQSSPELVQ